MNKVVEIEQNDFLKHTPIGLYVADVVYSEIPFRLSNKDLKKMYSNINDLGLERKARELSSYFVISKLDTSVLTGVDKFQSIKLHMEHGIVNAYLIQYGDVIRVNTTSSLLNYLKTKYKIIGDPCAGTGRSAEGFEHVILYDIDESKVELLRNKFN